MFLINLCLASQRAIVCFAQDPPQPPVEQYEPRAPQTDLLTLNGGKPNLSAADEGITAYKTDEIYQRGRRPQAVVTDRDGVVGKSEVIEVIIERP